MVNAATVGAFRIDRVLRETFAVSLRNFAIFFAVSAILDLPHLLITKSKLLPAATSRLLDVIVLLVTGTLAQAVVLHAAFEDMRGRRPQLARSIRVALGRAWSVICLALFITFGIVVGAFFLIIPGLFLMTVTYVATPACVVERLSVGASVDRSMQLTRGYRLKLFAMIGMLVVVDVLGGSVLGSALRPENAFLGDAGSFIWNAAWGVFYAVFGVVAYRELRTVKEGVDIDRIASVFD
jgi:hypothetical protein